MRIETKMKLAGFKIAFKGPANLATKVIAFAACMLAGNVAHAHLTYSGRDLGSYSGLTNGTSTITNQAVTGNYGWADAADGILGDSHRARAFRFHLDNAALVTLTVTANPTATTNSLAGLTPAFSVYAGLAALLRLLQVKLPTRRAPITMALRPRSRGALGGYRRISIRPPRMKVLPMDVGTPSVISTSAATAISPVISLN